MANDNETFDEVFAEAMNRKAVRDYRLGISNGMKLNVVRCAEDVVDYYAVRFRDAHRREVAELKRELELTRQQRNRARLDAQEKFVREVAELKARLDAVVKHLEKYKGTKEPDYCCADCIEDIAKEVGFSFASGEGGAE